MFEGGPVVALSSEVLNRACMAGVSDVEDQDRDALSIRHLWLAGEDSFDLEEPVCRINVVSFEIRDS